MGALDLILSEREYLEGSFSVADVAVGSYLLYIPAFFPDLDLTPWPNVFAYMQRHAPPHVLRDSCGHWRPPCPACMHWGGPTPCDTSA
jgi:glutathione S-transferase